MSSAPPVPPGPPGHLLFGSLPELRADWIGYLKECTREYGSVVRLRMPWPVNELIVIGDAALAEQIFLDDADSFQRSRFTRRMVAPVLGNGLLLAEGEAWRRQRRLVQPAFQRARMAEYVEEMACCAEEVIETWPSTGQRDVYADALTFTIRAAARTMFGALLDAEVERARSALGEVLAAFDGFKKSRLPLPLSVPTPSGLRLRRATRALDALIFDAIRERRRLEQDRGDLLSMLLRARDAQGTPLSDRQVRDELITSFAGGAEPSAITLAWSLYLLARHPEAAERIRAEVAEVAGQARVAAHHLARLRETERVIKETLRLFPPVWRISREAMHDRVLGGFSIRRGALLSAVPYLAQHDARYFDEPERFAPERWTAAFEQALPKFAYFPFGMGRRMCVGHHFALVELMVALATIVPRVHLEPGDSLPQLAAGAMLRPRAGVQLRISRGHARKPGALDLPAGPASRLS